MGDAKRTVYILKSLHRDATFYVGITSDISNRLRAHNAGLSPYTARDRPWRILVFIEFDEELPARRFEMYLKTGSGREFARLTFARPSVGRRAEAVVGVGDTAAGDRVDSGQAAAATEAPTASSPTRLPARWVWLPSAVGFEDDPATRAGRLSEAAQGIG